MHLPADHDELAKDTWNASYRLSEATTLWGEPPVPWVDMAARVFAQDAARCILDLPCGDGRNIPPLAAAVAVVLAMDTSANALTIANRALRTRELDNCVLIQGDIFDTHFGDNQLDGVFCCDVLGHLTDPAAALRELIRICKPGKHIVANVFALGDSTRGPNMVALGAEDYLFDHRFYFRFYDRVAVDALLREVGLEPETLELVRWSEPPHEGYREYEHEHESWLFVLRKPAHRT